VAVSTTGLADTHTDVRRQQDRQLLIGAGRCLQSSSRQAVVSSERGSSADLLGTTYIGCESPNGYSSDSAFWLFVALQSRHSADVPRRKPAANSCSWNVVASCVQLTSRCRCSAHSSVNSRRSLVSRGSIEIVEPPASFRWERVVSHHLLPTTEDSSVPL